MATPRNTSQVQNALFWSLSWELLRSGTRFRLSGVRGEIWNDLADTDLAGNFKHQFSAKKQTRRYTGLPYSCRAFRVILLLLCPGSYPTRRFQYVRKPAVLTSLRMFKVRKVAQLSQCTERGNARAMPDPLWLTEKRQRPFLHLQFSAPTRNIDKLGGFQFI